RRQRQRLEVADTAVHLGLVGDAVLGTAEGLELADIGAGDEGLAAGAAKHRNPQPVFAADARTGRAELLVHAPSHGVARRRPVEDHRRDVAVAAIAHLSIAHAASAASVAVLKSASHLIARVARPAS